MRKSLLLLIAGLGALSTGAQTQPRSDLFTESRSMGTMPGEVKRPVLDNITRSGASKTTTVGGSDWFFYNVACKEAGTGITAALIANYPDSNIYFPGGTPTPFYIWSQGIGVSFDPTSPYFSTAWSNSTAVPPLIEVNPGASYTVDSVYIIGNYQRVVTTGAPDTLYIDLTYADSAAGAYMVRWSGMWLNTSANILPNPPVNPWDTTWTIANAFYNWTKNAIIDSTSPVYRVTKILDAAAAIDTDANGYNSWALKIPTPIVVPPGNKIVAYAHFASANSFPLGTPNASANLWLQYGEDFGLIPLQTYRGDMNTGLHAGIKDRYHITGEYMKVNFTGGTSAPILRPTFFYTAPIGVHHPFFGFHVDCSGCFRTEVANTNLVSEVKAMPNPAGNMLTITYTQSQNATGKVTLTNILGQVVATQKASNGRVDINTSSLPGGVYVYSLEINGQRTSGRVVIAH